MGLGSVGRRPERLAAETPRGRSASAISGRGEATVRPVERDSHARHTAAARRGGSRHAPHASPHRRRRLVGGRARAGGGRVIPGLQQRAGAIAAGVAHPVRGLHAVGEAATEGRRPGEADRLLEAATRRQPPDTRTADRPSAVGDLDPQRRVAGLHPAVGVGAAARSPLPAGGGDTVYAPAGRLRLPALSLHGTGRHPDRHAHGQSQARRDRTLDWLLHQHTGHANKRLRQPELSRAARQGARGCTGGVRA